MSNRLEHIGRQIRTVRKQQNLSQIDLAVMVGIDRAYLSEIENGHANVTVNILYAIADALNVSITKLFDEN